MYKPVGDDTRSKIVELHSRGWNATAISKEVGFSARTVLNQGRKLGLDFPHPKAAKGASLRGLAGEVEAFLDRGWSVRKIAKHLGYSPSAVRVMLRDLGCDTSRKCYDVDLAFFDEINTEAKAYLLGLWYADGWITDHAICLCLTDPEPIEYAKECLGYAGPVYETPERLVGKGRRKAKYELQIARVRMVEAMASNGCLPRKSLVVEFPGEDVVPPSLHRHFARGYFDGDGCVHVRPDHDKLAVVLAGSRDFLEGLERAAGIASPYLHARGKIFVLKYECRGRAEDFLAWIYRDATFCLPRKREAYEAWKIREAARTPRLRRSPPVVPIIPLSERRGEILAMWGEGVGRSEIARRMGVTYSMIRTFLTREASPA